MSSIRSAAPMHLAGSFEFSARVRSTGFGLSLAVLLSSTSLTPIDASAALPSDQTGDRFPVTRMAPPNGLPTPWGPTGGAGLPPPAVGGDVAQGREPGILDTRPDPTEVRPDLRRVVKTMGDGTRIESWRLEGRGTPGAEVNVVLDGKSLGIARVDAAGDWRLDLEQPMASGEHRLGVASRRAAGGRIMVGDDVRLAIPSDTPMPPVLYLANGFGTAGARTFERPGGMNEPVVPPVMGDTAHGVGAPASRTAQAQPTPQQGSIPQPSAPPSTAPAVKPVTPQSPASPPMATTTKDGNIVDGFWNWTRTAGDSYDDVIRRLSGAPPRPAAPTPAEPPKAVVVDAPKPVAPTAARPPVQPTGQPTAQPTVQAKAPTPPAAPPVVVAQATPPPPTATVAPAPPAQAQPTTIREWIDQSGKDYQSVLRRLTEPTPPPGGQKPYDPVDLAAQRKAAEDAKKATEPKTADVKTPPEKAVGPAPVAVPPPVAGKVPEERKTAEIRRGDPATTPLVVPPVKAPETAVKAVDDPAKKAADEARRMAELKSQDDAKRIQEAQKRADDEAKRLLSEKATADRVAAEKAAAEKLALDRAAAEKLALDKAAIEKAAIEKAGRDKALADRLGLEKLAAEKLATEKLATEKFAAEKAAAEKAVTDKALMEKAQLDKLAGDAAMRAADAQKKADADRKLAIEKAATEAERLKTLADKAASERALLEKLGADRKRLADETELAARKARDLATKALEDSRRAQAEQLIAEQVRLANSRSLEEAQRSARTATVEIERQAAQSRMAEERRKLEIARAELSAAQQRVIAQARAESLTATEARRAEAAVLALADAARVLATAPAVPVTKQQRDAQQRIVTEARRAQDAVKVSEQAVETARTTVAQATVPPTPRAPSTPPVVVAPPPATPPTMRPRAPVLADGRSGLSKRLISRRGVSSARCAAAGQQVSLPGWYVVARGDTLSSIAQRHYGAAKRYVRIAAANRSRIATEDLIYVCQRLYLPAR